MLMSCSFKYMHGIYPIRYIHFKSNIIIKNCSLLWRLRGYVEMRC